MSVLRRFPGAPSRPRYSAFACRQLRFEPLEGRRLLATLFRINAGGPELAGSPAWQADTLAAPSSYSNAAAGGNTGVTAVTAAINLSDPSLPVGTPQALFQTERFDKSGAPNLLWDFPVAPGQYEVRLYFAETWSGAFNNGVRVFDVKIEGATVLDDYDIFADVGANKGVMKSFVVTSDGNLDVDFFRVTQNPAVKGIEILSVSQTAGVLSASTAALDFGSVVAGQSVTLPLTLTNTAPAGAASVAIDPAAAALTPSGLPFTIDWGQPTPVVLAPGQSRQIAVTYAPTTAAIHAATLAIPSSVASSPLQITLSGTAAGQTQISFAKSTLNGAAGLSRPTSLQFGPDGRLYVAQQDGLIRAYTIARSSANHYDVVSVENIALVQQIPNHNDDGALNPAVNTRLVTGLLVAGTAASPVLYVNSSDPRIGGGASGTDLNLDTNSGIISRLTKNGPSWTKLDLVRGLPRSEENHHANGLQLDAATNTLYIAVGGNTNMGAPSNNFSLLPEFALSAAILSVDLNAIGETTYDLPTLDDETRAGAADLNDPFGGNDGRNQARLVPGGPVQVFSPGFRNPYDLLIHSSGQFFTVDNGPNAGWGDIPIGEGPGGTATNGAHEPGVTYGDSLHRITGPGYYGGHPNPTRANVSNTFNSTNPQSPVSVGNPIEGDYRVPGPENGALAVFPESTNGIAEYGSNQFGGAMQGDLLIASFDNTIKRVRVNAAGQVVLNETLFSNVGFRPLDVTSPAAGAFKGTIWVVDVAQNSVTVFEPSSGVGGNPNDIDGDGYSNADEIANGSDPNSPAAVPPDFDVDFVSNLNDPDDDNDALPDVSDRFAVDAVNGAATPIGTLYDWENEGASLGGLLGMGFTGLMTNGAADYASLFNPAGVTAGGAAGVFTIDSALPGTAQGPANSQQQAFQFGVNVGGAAAPFVARTSLFGPFSGVTPQAGQEMGFYIGRGDQDNFIQLIISGDDGGSIKLAREVAGAFAVVASQSLAVPASFVELRLTIDPAARTLQASYAVAGGAAVNLGGAVDVPADWIAGAMAIGLIATDPTATGALPVTWDYLGVEQAPPAVVGDPSAFVLIEGLGGTILTGSTFNANSFRVANQSTGNVRIQSIRIDARTALVPDLVFDPIGEGGGARFKPFTPDSGAALTGQSGHAYLSPHDTGFDILEIQFNNFDPGEEFTFSIDTDPTSIKGSVDPGPSGAGHISGLELNGATVTVVYSDGSTQQGQTFRTPASGRASQNTFRAAPLATPAIAARNVAAPAVVAQANQTIRITGPAGATARLLQVEASLHLAGVPGGGYDVGPFEANKATKVVKDKTVTIGASGFVDVAVVLTKGEAEGGYNIFTAAIQDAQGRTSDNAPQVLLRYNPVASLLAAGPGDFNGDALVDGADFLAWQRALSSPAAPGSELADATGEGEVDAQDLAIWQENFGALAAAVESATFLAEAPLALAATATSDPAWGSNPPAAARLITSDLSAQWNAQQASSSPMRRRSERALTSNQEHAPTSAARRQAADLYFDQLATNHRAAGELRSFDRQEPVTPRGVPPKEPQPATLVSEDGIQPL
ncbi:MAG: PQQ-dependent sugar dehydrogenase [Planctomycetaceae bacterium]|nr:PQQ-dependent sugar dehydrogenase [Planctomycetaceae bacterium]